jgi:hypothetical protein
VDARGEGGNDIFCRTYHPGVKLDAVLRIEAELLSIRLTSRGHPATGRAGRDLEKELASGVQCGFGAPHRAPTGHRKPLKFASAQAA